MTGLKYHRIHQMLTLSELADKIGCSSATVRLYERKENTGKGQTLIWMKLSDVLDVPISELLRTDLPEIEDVRDRRKMHRSRTSNPNNCITIYCEHSHLTFKKLAVILDKTLERVRQICALPTPPDKYIKLLADLEGISAEEFVKKYTI